jgi:hypothetical protein
MKKLMVLFGLSLLGCNFQGTGTGNPITSPAQGATDNSVYRVTNEICQLLSGCYGLNVFTPCLLALSQMTTFAPRLGVATQPPPTLDELANAEYLGQIIPDLNAERACRHEITGFACADPLVQTAYQPAAPEPFAQTVELLQPVCADIFATAPGP